MINKSSIQGEFLRIRKNISRANTPAALDFLEKQANKTRMKYFAVYAPNTNMNTEKKVLEREYGQTIKRINSKRRSVK